ncbi:MAG: hypothetical protein PUQ00_07915 [Nostoc sp. S13]|nr:hypothetical protein [Nostoc sp. S13]
MERFIYKLFADFILCYIGSFFNADLLIGIESISDRIWQCDIEGLHKLVILSPI